MRIGIAIALCALLFPAAALAKGPTEATITGPGLAKPLRLGGPRGWTADSPMAVLTNRGGFFQAAWSGQPGRTFAKSPTARLGPKYRVVYLVPGPSGKEDRIRQDIYPFAGGGPVSYTPAGQPFFDTRRTLGGWFRAGAQLEQALVAAGLPAPSATTRPMTALSAGGDSGRAVWPAAVIALAALGGAALLLAKRRARPASA